MLLHTNLNLRRVLTALTISLVASVAAAEPFDDGLSKDFYKTMKGKTVGFVPISLGFDLTQGWLAGMQRQADELGYKIVTRDPNWNVEAGAQALNQLIAEKPDILIFHPLDMQAYNRLVKKANDANITTISINMKSVTNGDAFVGTDWYDLAVKQASAMAQLCGPSTSGKVAVIQGVVTTPTSVIGVQAIEDTLKKFPNIKIVANQSADWDATKAKSVASTILKQNPDLCGFIGLWDGMDVGTAAAIKEAGKTGKVQLVTSGGGNRAAACDNLANGSFTSYVSYDVPGQVRDLNNVIKILLQAKPMPAGSRPIALYTPLKVLTKETMRPDSCWTVDEIKKHGGYGG
jgi:ribose transport system substrate-binding protein